ncbi:GntR family transcriptional regulator [Rhizobium sp. EC-SD404]|uniref:GntR family transcriptional regulator n=1 Tax=Rhizobium sp. EC-SD404 TaxID=2038389 RepID=UPI0012570EC8|nr:GntR family transcriptional regulator [Rhizobium sp. EC-SD404]VVT26779.1 hypothetical protein RHIZ404_220714 [Rhizobium sp. EC-SD404]
MRRRSEAMPANIVLDSGVSASSKSPLYHQIYLVLRDQILAGNYRDGQMLPSEFDIAEAFGVSRITAKRAVTELAATSLVARFRGRGTVVKYKPENPPLRASVNNWLQAVSSMGRTTSVRVLDLTYGEANDEESQALQIAPGTEVQRSLRVRSHTGGPFSLLSTIVPAELGRHYSQQQLETTPLLELLQSTGIVLHHAEQKITATLANQSTASQLEMEVGSPLLKVQRVVFDNGDRPVEYLTALYRPDQYQLEMVLTSEQKLASFGNPVGGGDAFETPVAPKTRREKSAARRTSSLNGQ